ncbi:FCRLB protein, partial [Burhinus bistriatus]|nr:FCRLB protein [Burhinus bistriatus]
AGIPCHPAGTQLSQLTSDPPWMPVFRSEKVTLTCWGSVTSGPTNWYLNNRLWWQLESSYIHVKDHPGTYQCRSHGARLSPPITVSFSDDWLVLQVPTWVLLEGDELLLRCRA